MPYTSNPNLERVRVQAAKPVREDHATREVARHFGYSHSSVVRWVQRVQEDRLYGNGGVPTRSSRPKSNPRALAPEIVQAIINERLKHNRCAEVVHEDLLEQGIQVSLSSAQRTLARHELLNKKSKGARIREALPRPEITGPGALVQMDTIHIVDWSNGERFYLYTVIDLYSRWAYV